jgi:hypothetical protein
LGGWTSDPATDRILEDLIQRVGYAIPAERFSVYLMGSFAIGDGSPESDVDAAIIWQPSANTLELIGVTNAANNSRLLCDRRLDPLVQTPRELMQSWNADKLPGLIRASRLLHGTDLLQDIPMPDIEAHLAALKQRACSLMRRIRDGEQTRSDAALPEPNHPFFGYTRRRTWYPAGIPNGTREIVDLVASLAAPLAVALTKDYVTGKRNAIESFVAVGEDPWASFVSTLYERCALDWSYRIPDDDESRDVLRDLCLSVHAFENHYLQQFPC